MSVHQNVITATIANGASLSGAVLLGSGTLTQIHMPAAWTAASLTFQVSDDGVTYRDLYDASGTEYVVVAAASHCIQMPVADFQGIKYLKVRSGAAAAAQNQGAERLLVLVSSKLRPAV